MIVLCADHAGFELKEFIKKILEKNSIEYIDCGASEYNKDDDYPDIVHSAVPKVLENNDNAGIFVCGSGVGVSMVANRYKGIRAVLANDYATAFLARKDEDSNVLCMGARIVSKRMARKIIKVFFSTEFEAEDTKDASKNFNKIKMLYFQFNIFFYFII